MSFAIIIGSIMLGFCIESGLRSIADAILKIKNQNLQDLEDDE